MGIRRPLCRWLVFSLVALFFLNVALIAHIIDIQLVVHKFLSEVGFSPEPRIVTTVPSLALEVPQPLCEVKEPLASNAISRMRTEECRTGAARLLCGLDAAIPDFLPSQCPLYDESLRGRFLGCYHDSRFSRVLTGHLYRFKMHNSPQYCTSACLRAGYKFAGVEYREECFCGDQMNNATSLPELSCQRYLCPEQISLHCGGHEAISIFSTGIKEKKSYAPPYVEMDASSNRDVQILFLLQLNGRNFRQVMRMLRIIYSRKHLYIIHVDSRQQFMYDEMQRIVSEVSGLGLSNMQMMERRYPTIWGGASLLSMVFDAIREAVDIHQWTSWDFLFNLSESDFPVLSMSELEFHLARNKGRNFLSSHGYDTGRFIQKQGLDFVFYECENRMWRLSRRVRFPVGIRVDGGSDWVALSRDFALYSLSNDSLPTALREIFSNVLLPVESFFHTLAANSVYCERTLKGNLRLTNWKRKQGCRCAMLKRVVDWCGCSPLVFNNDDLPKFSLQAVKKRPAFWARKFDSLISQSAVVAAETQALQDRPQLLNVESRSLSKTWVNFFSARYDQSDLLTTWANALLVSASPLLGGMDSCRVRWLSSLHAYKEKDESEVETLVDVEAVCGKEEDIVGIQMRVAPRPQVFIDDHAIVDGFRLVDVRVGAQLDLKEEIFRDFARVLSKEKDICVYLRWERVQSASTSVTANHSSPFVSIAWTRPDGTTLLESNPLPPYDSIYGGQYTVLSSEVLTAGEWIATVRTRESVSSAVSAGIAQLNQRGEGGGGSLQRRSTENGTAPAVLPAATLSAAAAIARIEFAVFSEDGRETMTEHLVNKYFNVSHVCVDVSVPGLERCTDTEWSHSFPDPYSKLFF